jgi:hypothetical protein
MNLEAATLTDPVLYVMAGDVNAEADIDGELEQCVLESAERIYRQMPDALPPEVLAEEIQARRALLIILESAYGESVGGVAIGTKSIRSGTPYVALNVDVLGAVDPGFNFCALVESAALCRGLGLISIRSNGKLPALPGYSYEFRGDGFHIMTLELTIQ